MTDPALGLCPHIAVKDGKAAIAFYKDAFGAKELFRLSEPSGKLGHAELEIAGGVLMIAEEYPEHGAVSAETLGGSPVRLHLPVPDCDAATERAKAAGAEVLREPTDEFYGERAANVRDPFGYVWMLSQTIEKVTPNEMQRRWNTMLVED